MVKHSTWVNVLHSTTGENTTVVDGYAKEMGLDGEKLVETDSSQGLGAINLYNLVLVSVPFVWKSLCWPPFPPLFLLTPEHISGTEIVLVLSPTSFYETHFPGNWLELLK